MLRSVKPNELPILPPAPPEKFFTFQRTRYSRGYRWSVGFKEGNAWTNVSSQKNKREFATKDDAREWAKTLAVEFGVTYLEGKAWERKEYTPDELRRIRVNAAHGSVKYHDDEAEKYEEQEDFRRAAEEWWRAAWSCEKCAGLSPGEEEHLGRCGASRVKMAVRCLGRYGARLLAMRNGSSLREVPPASEEQSTEDD